MDKEVPEGQEAPEAKPVNPYDHGDTEIDPELDLEKSTADAKEGDTGKEAQPRGSDGKFVSAKEPEEPKEVRSHSLRVLRMARDLGIADEDIQRHTPDSLDDLVYYLNRATFQNSRQEPPKSAPQQDHVDLGLEEDQYDPHLVGALKSQAKRLKELEKRLEATQARDEERSRESRNAMIDRKFSSLSEEYKPLFGNGPGAKMRGDSDEFQRRLAVLATVERLKEGSLDEKFDRAVKALYPSAPAKKGSKADEWNEGAVARPTSRAGAAEPKGERKALKTAAKYMSEHGMLDEADDERILDGFLD